MSGTRRTRSVILRTARWPFIGLPVFVTVVLLAPLTGVVGDPPKLATTQYLLVVAGVATALTLFCYVIWRKWRGEWLRADLKGLVATSQRHGRQLISWADLDELGWVPDAPFKEGGIAARLRRPAASPGGTEKAGWLCHPSGVLPTKVVRLQRLAESQGVCWRIYRWIDVQ